MKKSKKYNEPKTRSISDDTLEFLSLDDETIEAYNQKMNAAHAKKKTSSAKKSIIHTSQKKREIYEEEDYETEELEEIEDERDVYYEADDEDDDTRYETEEDDEENEIEDDEYYETDDEEDDAYYEMEEDEEDEIEDDEYYEMDNEDEEDDEYYEIDDEEDEDEEDEEDDEYYEMDDEDEEDDEYYEIDDEEDEDDEYYEDDEDDDEGIFARFGNFLANMSSLDHVVLLFGCFVVIAAVMTGVLYAGSKIKSNQVDAFAEIGNEITQIGVIGESGLLAVSNAESARLSQMMESVDETQQEIINNNAVIEVSMNLTSIQSDIKIKFVNKQSNKLINSIPFEVEITGDNGKTYNLKDEDKDGIIYQTGVNAGTYTVKALALSGEEYEKYQMPPQGTIKVTDTIAYQKVDVADEIKTEAEVNVAAEDTAKQDTAVESTLTDTVEWVESTKTEKDADNNYQEIKKDDIPDPATIGKSTSFVKLVAPQSETGSTEGGNTGGDNTGDGGEENKPSEPTDEEKLNALAPQVSSSSLTLTKGESATLSVSTSGSGSYDSVTWSSSSSTASVTSSGVVTAESEGSATITATVRVGEASRDLTCSVTVNAPAPVGPTDQEKLNALAISASSLTLKKGESATLSITASGNGSYDSVTWSSSAVSVASVTSGGAVKAESVGTATITATVKSGQASRDLTCSVTVGEAALTDKEKLDALQPKLNSTALTLTKGGSAALSISVTGNEPYTVTWKSDSNVASVSNTGVVKGENLGNAKVTATVKVGTATVDLVCSVTVSDIKYTALKIEGSSAIQVGKTGTVKGTTTPAGGTVTWQSDNEKIVKIDSNGTMTGVAVGTATITGTCGDAKNTWKVTVTKDVSGDTTTKLKDKNGNQIFVKNADGKYVEATYADYYKDQILYLRKGEASYSYTGWQTIDGYTYYYDKNGNYVTGEQVIQGAKYSFGSDGRLSSGSGVLGIDVSKWNGSIDWNAVKNSGISYVIIRCGYRGSSTGALIEDPKFRSNIQGAKAAGLKVGVYFFSQAVNEVEAVEEASMAINLVNGYGLNYPIFLDVESSGGRGDKIDAGTRTAVCRAFCNTIQNSGYKAGVYANKTWLTSYMNASSLTGYKIWLAQYASTPSYTASKYDMWQYSSKGTVGGISGSVDMNISYMNY